MLSQDLTSSYGNHHEALEKMPEENDLDELRRDDTNTVEKSHEQASEKGPVEREAGMEISKAWEDVERKARKVARKTSAEREEEEEDLFATLEDDDDAIVLSRFNTHCNNQSDNEDSDQEEKQEKEGEGEEILLAPLSGATGPSAAPKPSSMRPPQQPAAAHHHLEGKASVRSNKSLPKKKKKKKKPQHRRTESVEQAMFGLLDVSSHNSIKANKVTQQVSSSNTRPLQAPLQATEQLILQTQARVQDVHNINKQRHTKKQNGKGHTLLEQNSNANNDGEKKKREFADIINEDGDESLAEAGDNDGQSVLNRIEEGDSEDEDEEDVDASDEETAKKPKSKRRMKRRNRSSKLLRGVATGAQQDWALFQQFLTPRKASFFLYSKIVVFLVILPSLAISALLFYLKEHPEQQEVENSGLDWIQEDESPFLSWWFLFLGVRQIITLTMALITQALLIDYLALGSRFSLKFMGPAVTLLAVQARGWPCVLMFWAMYDLVLLSGDRPFSHHWGYWQDAILLFNESNHSGNIVQNEMNFRILIIAIVLGIVVAIKRVILGLFLARKTLSQFGGEFEAVKKHMIMIGELATLAMELQIGHRGVLRFSSLRPGHTHSVSSMNHTTIKKTLATFSERSGTSEPESDATNAASAANKFVKNWKFSAAGGNQGAPGSVIAFDGGETADLDSLTFVAEEPDGEEDFEAAEEAEIAGLLGEWEGPDDRLERKKAKHISLGSILRFYKEITVMNRRYPFLPVFGRADTHDKCISSAQRLFDRLMLRTPTSKRLPFATIALLAKDDSDATLDKAKLRELIRMFRPDRDGKLSKLDFVKSIDAVYRDLRKLSLNIEDNVQIDRAVEFLFNLVFYFVVGSIVLRQLGFNPLELFVSLSSLIIGFTFIFASSSSKWFEGLLFILVQRPYGVGDRIHLSNPASETSANGSSGWIVEKVTLTTTTVYWGATNERATLSNGAIANLRVINAARSPKATIYAHMKFGIDTHHKKIQVFRTAAEQYLKRRPREWCAFIGFRPSDVVIDRGFIAYTLIAQHRESWQRIGAILKSKANLTTFMLEVSKQMGLRYLSPPLPVNLRIQDASAALEAAGVKSQDVETDKSKGSSGSFF